MRLVVRKPQQRSLALSMTLTAVSLAQAAARAASAAQLTKQSELTKGGGRLNLRPARSVFNTHHQSKEKSDEKIRHNGAKRRSVYAH